MLTPTAINNLRTIGFNQADFQIIRKILNGTLALPQASQIDEETDSCSSPQVSQSEVANVTRSIEQIRPRRRSSKLSKAVQKN